jgi:Kef-type K+ transport system membrane component KefB
VPPGWLLAPLDVAAIAALAWIGGQVAQRLRQPRIAGEMAAVFAAAFLLGGQIADVVPGQQAEGRIAELFGETALALVSAIGGLGLALYMLLVGLTIDPAPMRTRARTLVLLAAATTGAALILALIAGPLLAGAGGWKPPSVSEGTFVLALAAALAVNGLPIVARILEDRAMAHSDVGSIVIVAATLVTTLALIASAVAIGGGDAAALLLGPLIAGIAIKKASSTAVAVERCLGVAVRRVGLPAFLGLAALHTDLRELGSDVLAPVAGLLAAVVALKAAAGYAAARVAGFARSDARGVGALLQCGGVMTIAVSLQALQAHVIDPRMHAALTLVGLMTTIAAGPLLPRAWRRRPAEPEDPSRMPLTPDHAWT